MFSIKTVCARCLLTAILAFGGISAAMWLVNCLVEWTTTEYRIEWTGPDGETWWDVHEVSDDEGVVTIKVSFSDYWTRRGTGCYELKTVSFASFGQGETIPAIVTLGNRDPREITIDLCKELNCSGQVCHRALLPPSCAPQKEGDTLEITICVHGVRPSGVLLFKLKFVARRIRHCFSIFTCIT